jgi:hypothetical protein
MRDAATAPFPGGEPVLDLLARSSSHVMEASYLLLAALERPEACSHRAEELWRLKQHGQDVNYRLLALLPYVAAAPSERARVAQAARAQASVLDALATAIRALDAFAPRGRSVQAEALANSITRQAEALGRALWLLRRKGGSAATSGALAEVHRLSREERTALARAGGVGPTDPTELPALIEQLKWQGVHRLLVLALDRAAVAATALEHLAPRQAGHPARQGSDQRFRQYLRLVDCAPRVDG